MLPVPAVPGNPDNNNDDNGGEVLGPLVKSHVDLAKTAHKWLLSVLLFVIFLLAFLEWHCLQPHDVAAIVGEANFCKQLQLFIRDQQQDNNSKSNVVSSLLGLPLLPNKIFVYTSAVATFYAPSNISCITGMHSEHICTDNTYHHGNGHYDCMSVNTDPLQLGMHGLDVAHARLFFPFTFEWVSIPVPLSTGFQRSGSLWMRTWGHGLLNQRYSMMAHAVCLSFTWIQLSVLLTYYQ